MPNDVIKYKSAVCNIYRNEDVINLETSTANDITWRVDELTGYIIVKEKENSFDPTKFDVKLTEEYKVITGMIRNLDNSNDVCYEYCLIPHYAPALENLIPPYIAEPEEPSHDEMLKLKISDKMFFPSERNDRVLVVEGKKLHVSKAFLSYKESQMDEIPIKDVSSQDFALLLSSFYPNPVFPNDATVHKLLEMSRQFMVPSVIDRIQCYLIYY
ncbi:hypothetical protein GCK72_011368 [Caenorhabditis remanei]|uniref:BTB domain-containing protein n=1 Tax=Caenorhabditis remanei TaxID=31234 RepID=A0A6A5H9K0_CAERE|nr:hypothetical protein GCK72_011368 [Caenorhabditis remanei]KAF1763103.1 hypothetical protein GCK72_011368 [Caenorhabditis remanei]